MTTYTIDLPETMQECLLGKARENFREMSQEILYRLNQALKMERHISENEIGLFKVLSRLHEAQNEEEGETFKVSSELSETFN
jgi:hypothetical protein